MTDTIKQCHWNPFRVSWKRSFVSYSPDSVKVNCITCTLDIKFLDTPNLVYLNNDLPGTSNVNDKGDKERLWTVCPTTVTVSASRLGSSKSSTHTRRLFWNIVIYRRRSQIHFLKVTLWTERGSTELDTWRYRHTMLSGTRIHLCLVSYRRDVLLGLWVPVTQVSAMLVVVLFHV